VLAIIAFVAIPASFGISAVSTQLVDFVLGQKWNEAAPIIALLAFYGGIFAIQTNSGSVFNAVGKPHLIAGLGGLNVVFLLGFAIPLGYQFGAMGVAVALTLSVSISVPFVFFFVCRSISASTTSVIGVLWRPVVSSSIMYGCVNYLEQLLLSDTNLKSGGMLFILVLTGVLVYAISTLALWWLSGKPASADYRLIKIMFEKIRHHAMNATD
jgi:O-antigen/teichoic acid export membrane protein